MRTRINDIIESLVFIIVIAIIIGGSIWLIMDDAKTQRYCGSVVEMYRTDAGYRVPPEAHIIFYCPSLSKNIDVEVTNNCYANTKIGESICFQLNKYQVR